MWEDYNPSRKVFLTFPYLKDPQLKIIGWNDGILFTGLQEQGVTELIDFKNWVLSQFPKVSQTSALLTEDNFVFTFEYNIVEKENKSMFGFELDYDCEDELSDVDKEMGFDTESIGCRFRDIQPGETFCYKRSEDKGYSICTKMKRTITYTDMPGSMEKRANAIDGWGEPFFISDSTLISINRGL